MGLTQPLYKVEAMLNGGPPLPVVPGKQTTHEAWVAANAPAHPDEWAPEDVVVPGPNAPAESSTAYHTY